MECPRRYGLAIASFPVVRKAGPGGPAQTRGSAPHKNYIRHKNCTRHEIYTRYGISTRDEKRTKHKNCSLGRA